MENPLISIIVPTFNSAFFIKEMLDSLLIQSYKNFEVIISDGNSSDNTLTILNNYSLLDIKIDSRKDLGPADALNRGFSVAKGDILCWLNSDDFYLSKDSLLNVVECFNEKKCTFCYGHSIVVDNSGIICDKLFAHIPFQGFETYGTNLMTGSLFFSKNCWTRFGGFSLNYNLAFEYELINFLFEECGKPSLINSFLTAFRVHPSGLSSKYKENLLRESEIIFKNRKKRYLLTIKLERLFSQIIQGTFLKFVTWKIFSVDKGLFCKNCFN